MDVEWGGDPNFAEALPAINAIANRHGVLVVSSSLEEYVDATTAELLAEGTNSNGRGRGAKKKKTVDDLRLFERTGEIRSDLNGLKNIAGTMVSQKIADWRCAAQLERYVEPLRCLLWSLHHRGEGEGQCDYVAGESRARFRRRVLLVRRARGRG